MVRIRRPGFSDFEKAEIWRGWKSGKTLRSIGRGLGRRSSHVRMLVAANGGFIPAARRRSTLVLSRVEREEISRGIAAGHSMRAIATSLKRERVNRRQYRTRSEARADVFDYIERFHNPRRAKRIEQLRKKQVGLIQPSVETG